MSIGSIDVVSVPVSDQDRARDFYVEKLGFTVTMDADVGQRWLEDHWAPAPTAAPGEANAGLLERLHEAFGGQANLATIAADGSVRHYAGNTENPVFTFRLGEIQLASTAIYSIDRSLFRFVAPDARSRGVIAQGASFTAFGRV